MNSPQFVELVSCYLDASLMPEQEAQLLEYLREPGHQQRFLELVRVHTEVAGLFAEPVPDDILIALIEQDLAADQARPRAEPTVAPLFTHSASSREPRKFPSRVWRWCLAGAAATVVLVMVFVGAYLSRRPASPSPTGDEARQPAGQGDAVIGQGDVAIITRTVNAVWDTTELPTAVGSRLVPGRLKLKSGFAQVEFYSGATIILEGPADFELLGTDHGFCRQGKLRAKLAPQSRGFTVSTPTVDLVDLGTEFGMQVDQNGGGEVQVFEGKVELHRKDAGQVMAKQEVAGGQGMRIDSAGALQSTVARPEAFVGVAELERRSLTEMQRHYRAWQDASRSLQSDPRLVLYYSFEGQQRWDRTLRNQGPGGRGDLDGAIVGCQWVSGRWPGKAALEFKGSSDRVRLHVPGTYDSMTWMAWVRVDALEHKYTSLLLTDGFEENAPHWQISLKGEIVLGMLEHAPVHRNYLSPAVLGPERLGHWLQLATVYDGRSRTVSHYVNGQSVSNERMAFHVPLRLGNAEIGNWGVARTGDRNPLRSFNGRMDELALFGQALTAEEIQALYESGKTELVKRR